MLGNDHDINGIISKSKYTNNKEERKRETEREREEGKRERERGSKTSRLRDKTICELSKCFRSTTMLTGALTFVVLFMVLSSIRQLVATVLGDLAMLTCEGTCGGDFSWTFIADEKKLKVLNCDQDNCTEGDGFRNRVNFSPEKIKNGHLSLTIKHALYNDAGWYEASCDSNILCDVRLEVLVPVTVNAFVGDDVTLSCYANTEKLIVDDAVNIMWKKINQTVLQVKNGITSYSSGVLNRASISVNKYKDGDLSLTLHKVTPSDKGSYRCYYNTEGKNEHPQVVILNVKGRQNLLEKKFGDLLTLDLLGLDQVKVCFNSLKTSEIEICTVDRGHFSFLHPNYTFRMSVMDDSLVLSGLTASDRGIFTVKDKMGEIVSLNTVTVKDTGVRLEYHIIVLSGLSALTILYIGLFCWCQHHGRMKEPFLPL